MYQRQQVNQANFEGDGKAIISGTDRNSSAWTGGGSWQARPRRYRFLESPQELKRRALMNDEPTMNYEIIAIKLLAKKIVR